MAVIETSPSPPGSADRRDRVLLTTRLSALIQSSITCAIGSRWMIAACWVPSTDRRAGDPGVALCPTGSAVAPGVSCACSLNTFVHPQKITLTCQIAKIALRACDVGIPFAADRHGARTPCRSSRKPRGVVMAHAVRKDIALRRSSRSAKDFQIGPADAIHNYVKAPLMSESIMAQCLLPVD
jgi:hypothetical protein